MSPESVSRGCRQGVSCVFHAAVLSRLGKKDEAPICAASTKAMRAELRQQKILHDNGGSLVFTKDHLFSSPSQAAAVILARTANGRIEWRTTDGLSRRFRNQSWTAQREFEGAQLWGISSSSLVKIGRGRIRSIHEVGSRRLDDKEYKDSPTFMKRRHVLQSMKIRNALLPMVERCVVH
jgi:Domain of unknown function (DUF4357)